MPAGPIPTVPQVKASVAPSPAGVTPASIITNAVMAQDVKGDTYEPVGITDTFGAEQAVFHAVVTVSNAPSGTVVKGVWIAVDVGSVAPPNTNMGETEMRTEGSRNLHITFKPSAGRLPPGTYKVDISVNDKLDRTLRFSVTGAPATSAQSTPVTTGGCPPLPPPAIQPSGIIASVTMALDATSDLKEPVNPTTVFSTNATFHAVVRIQNAPVNTKVGLVWYVTDAGNAAPCNTRLGDPFELAADGTRNIDFTLKPPTAWPAATYRVQVYVNGVLDRVVNFSVK